MGVLGARVTLISYPLVVDSSSAVTTILMVLVPAFKLTVLPIPLVTVSPLMVNVASLSSVVAVMVIWDTELLTDMA